MDRPWTDLGHAGEAVSLGRLWKNSVFPLMVVDEERELWGSMLRLLALQLGPGEPTENSRKDAEPIPLLETGMVLLLLSNV